jgi:outer membrane lipase/esterase
MVVKGKHWAALLCALVLGLAGCGGGDPVEPYVPTRVIAFGDELSLIESDGRKHTVNALNATTALIDCVAHPLWVQVVAHGFGMSFPQCPNGTLPTNAAIRAGVGEKVADLEARVTDYIANGINGELPKRQDQVLMLVGMHDVLELFNEVPRRTEAAMVTELGVRGTLLAQQVNRLATRAGGNPAVIVATMPDVGLTPFALSQAAGDAALLTRLSAAFNSALRVNMVQDGRLVGIVFADAEIDSSAKFPDTRAYTNVTQPACALALPGCTTATLVTGATATSHLWADTLRPAHRFHEFFGAQALSRAVNNPF